MSEFHYEKVKDPTYFSENRVAAHSDHRYYHFCWRRWSRRKRSSVTV